MRSSLLTIIAAGVSLASVDAMTIAPLQFADLVVKADIVAYGRISAVRGQWTDDRQAVDSLVTLDVIERFKGAGGARLTFKVPGGRAGHVINALPGAPTFREGDLVVLFLSSHGPALPTPVGLSQGVLRVHPDPRSGDLLVGPPLGFGGESGTVARGSASRAPIPLSSLGEGVRVRVEAGR